MEIAITTCKFSYWIKWRAAQKLMNRPTFFTFTFVMTIVNQDI